MLAMSGCESGDPISRYTVPKELPGAAEVTATESRMLAAIISRSDQGWFFKITGEDEAVSAEWDRFVDFLKSVEYRSEDSPTWKLPDGWKQEPGSGMRFATVQVETSDPALEMSVIALPKTGDEESYLLANIDRWRGQLGLEPTPGGKIEVGEDVNSKTIQFELGDGTTVTAVDLFGTMKSDSMGTPPFAGGGTPPMMGSRAASATSTTSELDAYKAPDEWSAGQAGGMRKAAFDVKDGSNSVEITVTNLAAAAGELLPNVNRWRGQVSLAPVTQAELEASLQSINLGDVDGSFVELAGPDGQTILGVIAVHGDKAWFVKLTGDSELAEREKERFEEFVRSIRFRDE